MKDNEEIYSVNGYVKIIYTNIKSTSEPKTLEEAIQQIKESFQYEIDNEQTRREMNFQIDKLKASWENKK